MAETFSVQPLIEAWRRASEEVKREIGELALAAAERAAQRIADAYPHRSGLLKSSVRVGVPRGWAISDGAVVPARVVRAGHPTAPHIHFVEQGIAGRRRIAARPTFVPTAIEERQAYLQQAQALLTRDRELL